VKAIYIESLVIEVAEIAGTAHRASAIQHCDGERVDAETCIAEGNERRVDACDNKVKR